MTPDAPAARHDSARSREQAPAHTRIRGGRENGSDLLSAARCHGCDWTAAGTPADVDRAADKHTRKGHPTATTAAPYMTRERGC